MASVFRFSTTPRTGDNVTPAALAHTSIATHDQGLISAAGLHHLGVVSLLLPEDAECSPTAPSNPRHYRPLEWRGRNHDRDFAGEGRRGGNRVACSAVLPDYAGRARAKVVGAAKAGLRGCVRGRVPSPAIVSPRPTASWRDTSAGNGWPGLPSYEGTAEYRDTPGLASPAASNRSSRARS